MHDLSDADLLRHSRHILLDEIGIEGVDKLRRATVLVIGCGGLGSAALPFLAGAGIGRLLIADSDTVDQTNLPRQLCYTAADTGCLKTEAMAARLTAIHPDCRIETFGRLGETELLALLPECDVLLDCSDNAATRRAANAAAFACGKPLVSGAATRFEGQLAVYRADGKTEPCYACLFGEHDGNDGACALFGVFSPLVGIIGSAQAAQALKLILGLDAQSGVFCRYHALDNRWQSFRIARDPCCPVCGTPEAA